MSFWSAPTSANLIGWWKKRRSAVGVLPPQSFDRALACERDRSDRSGREFSVVTFRPIPDARKNQVRLARALRERARCYDVVGYRRAEELATLLPDTDGTGAWRFVDGIRRLLNQEGFDVKCQVLRYAGTKSDDDREGPPSGGGDRMAPSVRERREPDSGATTGERVAMISRPVEDLAPALARPLPLWKRSMDVVIATVALVLCAPLFAVAAAAIRSTSRGPVIFRQKRAGLGGRPFHFYKFRTMYTDAEARKAEMRAFNEQDGPIFKMRCDPRMTPVGRWLRKTSVDELPQLWNVLRGDMTLVGPRPPTLDEIPHYEPWQRRRLEITGGLTCIWQVSGRSEIGFVDWMRMDLRYARQESLVKDLEILARTPWAMLSCRGAY